MILEQKTLLRKTGLAIITPLHFEHEACFNDAGLGISRYLKWLLFESELSKNYDVVLLTDSPTSVNMVESLRLTKGKNGNLIKVIRCWYPIKLFNLRFLFLCMKTVKQLIEGVIQSKVDLVHFEYGPSHGYGGTLGEPILMALVFIKWILRKPITVTLHSVCRSNELKEYVTRFTRSRTLSTMYVVWYMSVMRLITKISDAIIGLVMHELSESTRVIKRWGAKRKIYEVVHGVPIIKNNISSPKTVSSKIEKNDFRVLVFGGIHPAKAYELVLHAFKRFLLSFGGKGVKLIIAGHPNPGPLVGHNESYAEFLKKLASELGITDHIELYCRYLSEEEVSFLFDTSDALIVSYGIRIGPSGVFARAISHKLPTIITADEKYVTFKSPLPAIIVPGTGRSESEIIEGIAKALSLLKTNKFLADKLKVKMEKYRLKYSFNKIGEAYLKIFEHVIEGYK